MKNFVTGERGGTNLALLFDNGEPVEFFAEAKSAPSLLWNVYAARVENVRPNGFSFLNLGEDGKAVAELAGRYKAGDLVTVMVEKEFSGTKFPAATPFVTVSTPSVVWTGGDAVRVSRRAAEQDRQRFYKIAADVGAAGVIFRSGGADNSDEEIKKDLAAAISVAKEIKLLEARANAPIRLRKLSFLERAAAQFGLRDGAEADFGEEPYAEILRRVLSKTAEVADVGNLVIEQTEAFVSVDVNTGAEFRYGNEEDTAYYTNLKVAEAVAKEIRLKNLSGTILVDAISMREDAHKKEVAEAFRRAFFNDSSKTEVTGYTKTGIYEITRERRGISVCQAYLEEKC